MRYARFLVFAVCAAAVLAVLSIGQFAESGLAQPIPLPGREDPPRVTATRPANGEVNVLRNTFIAADITFPAVSGNGVDPATLNENTVYLHPTGNPGNKVPAEVNTSGGNDSIVLTPGPLLESNTQYTYVVTSGVKDLVGNAFEPFTMSFTTGTNDGSSANPAAFTYDFAILGYPAQYTTLLISKDTRLYATTTAGTIRIFDINPNGYLSFDRELSHFAGRSIIGIVDTLDSTPNAITLWVVNNDLYTGEANGKHFTGRISKLIGTNINTGSENWTKQDYIVGLPRSRKDHLTNSIVYGPDGALYVTQGSISAMGRADEAWGLQPEVMLSAAVLRIDVGLLEAGPLPLNVATGTVDGSDNLTSNYGLGETIPPTLYDPLEPGAPLTIFASGVRNAYDLVWHSNGQLYVPTNGSAAGGKVPAYAPGTPCQNRVDDALFGDYQVPNPPPPQQFNLPTQDDFLYRVVANGYYGHPNPKRCEWVANGGNPTAGVDPAEIVSDGTNNGYPVGVQPDRNWRGFAFNFATSASPNGVIEYQSNIYDGAVRGKLLVTRYSGGKDIVALTPGGANLDIVNYEVGIQGFDCRPKPNPSDDTKCGNPLDLVEDRRNGNIYVAEFGSEQDINGKIGLLKPVDPNAAPLVTNDSYSVVQATPLIVSVQNGVLSNDFDQNGDPISALLWTAPQQSKSFSLNADGSFTYVPKNNFTGIDSFSYKVSDTKTTSQVATVTIGVTPGAPTPGPSPTTTIVPTATPIPPTQTPIPDGARQLVFNGGFEGVVSEAGVPFNWQVKNGKGEKVKCNDLDKLYAFQGQCAFMFKKSDTEDSRLKQTLDVTNVAANDTLVISFYATTKNVQAEMARALLKIKYVDGGKKKMRIYTASDTTPYTKYTDTVTLKAIPTKLKLLVRFNGTTGKYFVDDVSVVSVPVGSAAQFSDSLLELPQ